MAKFHPIPWYGNFVEAHSFRRASGKSPETAENAFSQNFHTRKFGEISLFYLGVTIKNGHLQAQGYIKTARGF